MKGWRPDNWAKVNPYPCEGCPDIQIDHYGYLCDLACGKRTVYFNKEAGADAMLEALKAMGTKGYGNVVDELAPAVWLVVIPQEKPNRRTMGLYPSEKK